MTAAITIACHVSVFDEGPRRVTRVPPRVASGTPLGQIDGRFSSGHILDELLAERDSGCDSMCGVAFTPVRSWCLVFVDLFVSRGDKLSIIHCLFLSFRSAFVIHDS